MCKCRIYLTIYKMCFKINVFIRLFFDVLSSLILNMWKILIVLYAFNSITDKFHIITSKYFNTFNN